MTTTSPTTAGTSAPGALSAPGAPRPAGLARGLLLTLALLSAVAPVATDLYLSAFPQMVVDLRTSATGVQLTLTAFLLGSAAGQLVFGPLSDRFGRRGPLVAGLVLCVVASAVAVVAPGLGLLVVARVAQGLGGAAGLVVGRAVITDLVAGPAAARALSLMMVVGGVAPVVAPLAGGFLVGPIGWRGVLAVVLGLAVLMLVAVLLVVPETNPAQRRAELLAQRRTGTSTARALRSRAFVGSVAAFAFGFAVMMAYISASPFLYQELMGLGRVQYGLLFGVNALLLAVVSAVSGALAGRLPVRRLLGAGLAAVLASCLVLAVLVAAGAPAGWLTVPIAAAVGGLGLVLGNGTALALAAVPSAAGSASAVLGAAQFGIAALVSPLVGLGGGASAGPLAVVMLAAAVLAAAGFVVSGERPPAPSAA